MQRTPSSRLSGAARPSHRQSGEFRGRHSFGANGDNGAGVAQTSAPISNGHVRTNGMMGGSQHFDLARSPPTTTNKSNRNLSLPYLLLSSDSFHMEQTPNMFPANSSNKAHVKPDKHAPSFIRPMRLLTRLPVNISQRFVEIRIRGLPRQIGSILTESSGQLQVWCKMRSRTYTSRWPKSQQAEWSHGHEYEHWSLEYWWKGESAHISTSRFSLGQFATLSTISRRSVFCALPIHSGGAQFPARI
jgi:hypothetical protein